MKHFRGSIAGGRLSDVDTSDRGFIAYAIGPDSDYDQVRIDGVIVAAGRLVPVQKTTAAPTIEFVTGPLDSAQAHVIAYECGDELVNPGPRPSRVYTQRIVNETNTLEGNASIGRGLVVPFTGRRAAHILVTPRSSSRIEFAVYGRTWHDPDAITAIEGSPYDPENPTSSACTTWPLYGTRAAPITTAEPASGLEIDNVQGSNAGAAFIVGGTESAEAYDELLVVWGRPSGDAVDDCDGVIIVRTVGELGAA